MDILKNLTKPSDDLFYRRGDPNDRKMGELVSKDPGQYEKSEIVILGCPQDEGVRRNKGRPGAAGAPDEIRKQLYKFSVPSRLRSERILDLGNVKNEDKLEDTHFQQYQIVRRILSDEKIVIILGGGNDISYPDGKALANWEKESLFFNIDSHFDVRADEPRNSGTPYRQLLEENYIDPQRFFQIGWKDIANSPVYRQYLETKGVAIYQLDKVRDAGIENIVRPILKNNMFKAIFWGFDLDVVRAVDAPGVSAPYPTGLTADELCSIAKIAAGDFRSKILEISEVNPVFDIDNRTTKLAAMVILYFLNSEA